MTSGSTHQATVATKGASPPITPKETRHAPKMAAWCEREHPPQSQRTMQPSGGEGKASTTAAAVTSSNESEGLRDFKCFRKV